MSILGRRRGLFVVCGSAVWDQANAILGTQRNGRKDFDGVSWYNLKTIFLLNHGQQQRGFHHRERCANTSPRSASKWKIGESGNLARAYRVVTPAFRVESFRVGEEARIALRAPLQNKDV